MSFTSLRNSSAWRRRVWAESEEILGGPGTSSSLPLTMVVGWRMNLLIFPFIAGGGPTHKMQQSEENGIEDVSIGNSQLTVDR